ncbi:twin-arginine translocation pathway signal protein [Ideonella sp. DXS22W]|uniref:Twin-arginine translocation pathway signal protein n=1 Tax=Pseudaquabacterium inlustre TaxID=2984192 RepID=A0ABU9CHV9_9BURK
MPPLSDLLPSRRRFIALTGGGAVFATLPLGGCASTYPDEATQAWRATGPETDLRRHMLAHALLAPNPHNRQPWIADLSQPGRIGLLCDGQRLLPETDPFGRQILIGCGAFIELAVIAAAARGVAVEVQLFPDGAPAADALPRGHRVAVLHLRDAGSAPPDPLFAQIAQRHTNKAAYANDRALPVALTAQWAQTAQRFGLAGGVVSDAAGLERLRAITREAYEIECLTPRTWLESAQLMRIGPDAIARHRDGISLNERMPRLLHALGLFDPLQVPQPGSANLERVMARWAPFETGSGYLWLASSGNTRPQQVDAGRAYVRQHLQATAAGVQMHPLSQALQEFAEVRRPYLAVHQALGLDPQRNTVQMLARTGFALQATQPSPRRGLQALLQA